MNTRLLEEAREIWLKEKAAYEKYGVELVQELKAIFKSLSIPVTLSYRVKTDDSLLKKMLLKNKLYNQVNDKVGVRAIVHFKSDLIRADSIIQNEIKERILKRENKIETADDNTFGYASIHYDIVNTLIFSKALVCELQLRTVCQNAWSELAHILSYKPGIELPHEIKREVNALSALMEVADNQFQIIYDMINKLPVSNPIRILREIDGFFYSHIAAWFDTEMSFYFLSDIEKIYDPDEDTILLIRNFIETYGKDIETYALTRNDILFFSQPEIIVILERLSKKKHALEEYWQTKYPLEQLEEIANAWGEPLR